MLAETICTAMKVSLAGGVLTLDRTAVVQAMVSRPIVTAPVVGFWMGNVPSALMVGIILELLLIGDLPVGRYIPVHETGLAVLATAITVTILKTAGYAPQGVPDWGALKVFPLALFIALPVSWLYQRSDVLARNLNARLFEKAQKAALEGSPGGVILQNMKGALYFFVISATVFFLTIAPLTAGAEYLFERAGLYRTLYPASVGCVVLGLGIGLNALYTDKKTYALAAGGAAAAVFAAMVLA